jgi:AAA domain-containing protein
MTRDLHAIKGLLGDAEVLPPLEPVDLLAWVDKDPPPRGWAVFETVPIGAVTSLYGHGGSGKSLLALDLIVATAANCAEEQLSWLGRNVAPGIAVGLFSEDDVDECVRRLKRICARRSLSLGQLAPGIQILPMVGEDATLVGFFPGTAQPYFTPLWHRLEALLADQFATLLILDFAAAVFGGDELKRDQVAAFMRALNGLAQRHSLAVLLLGHPSADGLRNGRGHSGSTAWHNHARAFLHLEASEEVSCDDRARLTLTVRKNNYARAGDKLTLAFDGTLFEVIAVETITHKVRSPRLSHGQKICLQALKKALDEEGEPSPGGPVPAGVRCVRIDLWRRYAYQMGVSGSADDSSRRRAFFDTRRALQAKGLVGLAEPYAWLASGREDKSVSKAHDVRT